MPRVNIEECVEILKAMGAYIPAGPPQNISGIVNVEHIHPFTTPQGKRRPGKGSTANPTADHNSYTVFAGELPPWGQLDDALWADIAPPIPLDWRLSDGQWWDWVRAVVHDIDTLIWPKYAQGAWTDARVGRILDADFTLLAELRPCMGLPIDSVFPTIVQHADFFKEEDDSNIGFGTSYRRYDPTLPSQVIESLPTVLTAGIVDKVGSLDLLLKLVFQRPRAYQVAFLQGRRGFTYQSAATANTPSLVSGHCLQACLAGCAVFAAFAVSAGLNATSVKVLQQFTVDVGDRRVFGGVHYPSDSLSSWLTALKLVPFVFDEQVAPDIIRFLWSAITTNSAVYRAIKAYRGPNNGESPYAGAIEMIDKLAFWNP
jgi:hypothetical protein